MSNLMPGLAANLGIGAQRQAQTAPTENRPKTQKTHNSEHKTNPHDRDITALENPQLTKPMDENTAANTGTTQNAPKDFKKVLEKHMSKDKKKEKVEKTDTDKPTEKPQEKPSFAALPAFEGQITVDTMKERIAKFANIKMKNPKEANTNKPKTTNKTQKPVHQQEQSKQTTENTESKPNESRVVSKEPETTINTPAKTDTKTTEVVDNKEAKETTNAKTDTKTTKVVANKEVTETTDAKTTRNTQKTQDVTDKTNQPINQAGTKHTEKTSSQPEVVQNKVPDEQKTQLPANQSTDKIKPQQLQDRTQAIKEETTTELQEKPAQTQTDNNTTKSDNNPATTDPKTTLSEKTEIFAQKDINDLEANIESTKVHNESNTSTVTKTAVEIATAVKAIPITQPTGNTPTTTASATVNARSNINAISDSPANPAQQIIQSIRMNTQGPQQELNINLHPSELGTVRIRFQQLNGVITGTIEVDNPRTRYEIEKEIPEIVTSLQNNGLQVRRVDVAMSKQQDNTQSNNHETEDFNTHHQEQFSETSHNKNDSDTKSSSTIKFDTEYSQTMSNDTKITDDTINVYV